MNKILSEIEELKKSDVGRMVKDRIESFNSVSQDKLFEELCFCILTANSSAQRCIEVQEKIGKGFLDLSPEKLVLKMKESGARFYNKRAQYIIEARDKQCFLNQLKNKKGVEAREWLVNNIKGIGMKEASHFLRNIGFNDVAIVDFHIIDLLCKESIIQKPTKLDKDTYVYIENQLSQIGSKAGLTLAELDLYLWYIETGKILK